MSGVKVSCPACGGPIVFPIGSAIVAVCTYCRSVVARGDQRVEDLGKVAALVETDSALEIGLKGHYHKVPFEVTGRTQLAHPAGGVWNEWYAAFADGRWGWLAEAQGRFYLTFEQPPSGSALPSFEALELGQPLRLPHGPASLTVTEKSHARAVSAEGAIPYRLVPGVTSYYADLSGPAGEFATLDYSETPPQFFVGCEVTLDDLGVQALVKAPAREARQVAGVHLNCPHCGGALELRAPDKTERVVCPNCGALLDVNQGQLRYLKTLEPGKVKPVIPLGTVGKLNGQAYMAIGFLRRSVRFEGVKYFWEEYLLYDARLGFRWLVCSDSHWNLVESLPPGAVGIRGRAALWKGQEFKVFQKATATVENVQGECYWKVKIGEKVQASDYIRPPQMLSCEVTVAGGDEEGEINWSLGTYLPAAEVQKAFGLKALSRPAPFSVAPNQPFRHKSIYLLWGLSLAVAVALLVIVMIVNTPHKVFEQTLHVVATNDPEKPQVIFTEPFQLHGRQNVRLTVRAELNNAWLDVEGDLIQENGDLVQPFSAPVEFYQGVEDGESWTEGSKETTVYLSALPAGSYRLRLEVIGDHAAAQTGLSAQPAPTPTPVTVPVSVRVEQGTVRLWTWVLAVLALSVIPVLVGLYHLFFERQRWADSAFSPFHTATVKDKSQKSRVELVDD